MEFFKPIRFTFKKIIIQTKKSLTFDDWFRKTLPGEKPTLIVGIRFCVRILVSKILDFCPKNSILIYSKSLKLADFKASNYESE